MIAQSANTVAIYTLIVIAVLALSHLMAMTLPCNKPLGIIFSHAQWPRILVVAAARFHNTVCSQIMPTTQIVLLHPLHNTFLNAQNFVDALSVFIADDWSQLSAVINRLLCFWRGGSDDHVHSLLKCSWRWCGLLHMRARRCLPQSTWSEEWLKNVSCSETQSTHLRSDHPRRDESNALRR
jgi:hypothetical protein